MRAESARGGKRRCLARIRRTSLGIGLASALAAALALGCGDDDSTGGSDSEAATAFCAEAPDIVNGLATIEVLGPGATRSQLEQAHGVIQSELGDISLPSGTPEADALGPAIDDVLALSAEDLDTAAGAEALATAGERVEAFESAEC
jgi:hypothetical protein